MNQYGEIEPEIVKYNDNDNNNDATANMAKSNDNSQEFGIPQIESIINQIDNICNEIMFADPNIERSLRVRQALQSAVRVYKDLHQAELNKSEIDYDKFQEQQQETLKKYFRKLLN